MTLEAFRSGAVRMSLREAITRGAALRPQAFGVVTVGPRGGERTCVEGAAYEGLTGRLAEADSYIHCKVVLIQELPELKMHLNDYHVWNREAIADWAAFAAQGADVTASYGQHENVHTTWH